MRITPYEYTSLHIVHNPAANHIISSMNKASIMLNVRLNDLNGAYKRLNFHNLSASHLGNLPGLIERR